MVPPFFAAGPQINPSNQSHSQTRASQGRSRTNKGRSRMPRRTLRIFSLRGGPEEWSQTGDCAYGNGATRQQFDDARRVLVAKVPAPPVGQPCHKAHFVIDLEAQTLTCPAGHTTRDFTYMSPQVGATPADGMDPVKRFHFPAGLCSGCALKSACLSSKSGGGRSVILHPQEGLIQSARAYQKTEAYRQDLRSRQAVEHRLARLVQLGIRQARYLERAKTRLQGLLAATVANLSRARGRLAAACGSGLAQAPG